MSDIARVYAPGKEPELISGTAAADAAGSGVPRAAGKELASNANGDKAHHGGDMAR